MGICTYIHTYMRRHPTHSILYTVQQHDHLLYVNEYITQYSCGGNCYIHVCTYAIHHTVQLQYIPIAIICTYAYTTQYSYSIYQLL